MVTKKKERKNDSFKKVKLKVGKRLKKTTTTDTTITAKKLVLSSQLTERTETADTPLSFRGLSLDDLCKQLGHFNKGIQKEALVGTKQLLTSRPDMVSLHLRTLIPSVARLLSENIDQSLSSHLKALLGIICSAPSDSMSAHFSLFVAHILRAMTHMELNTRVLAMQVLSTVMASYPKLCRNSSDLFHTFVKFLGSSRKPPWNAPKFLETIGLFVKVFSARDALKNKRLFEVTLDTTTGIISSPVNLLSRRRENPFDFPVMTTAAAASASPFELPESIISLSQVMAPILTTSLMEDKGGAFLSSTISILEEIGYVIENQSNSFLVPDFRQQLASIWAPTKKAVATRKSDRIKSVCNWM